MSVFVIVVKDVIRKLLGIFYVLTKTEAIKRYRDDYLKLKKSMPQNYRFKLLNDNPQLDENVASYTSFGIYTVQDSWAFSHIIESRPDRLVDIASSGYFVAFCSKITRMLSVDFRKFETFLDNHEVIKGDVTSLPFESNSIAAISSLSVIEHIGLGRYGDQIDICGMEKAAKEMSRVLCPGGMLLVAFPTGFENVISFNAHRICTPEEAVSLFNGLKLEDEKYAVQDGLLDRKSYDESNRPYAYGCYRFTKCA